MQLNDEQKQKVAAWIADGLKLSDIQIRLGEEFDVRLTYMDTRLLVDDLKLMPKDPPQPEPPKPAEVPAPASPAAPGAEEAPSPLSPDAVVPPAGGKVTLNVDTLARPGTMVSGSVTFSDGKLASWYLDQTGRLGVVPSEQGYRPPAGDVEEFQAALDRELSRMGF